MKSLLPINALIWLALLNLFSTGIEAAPVIVTGEPEQSLSMSTSLLRDSSGELTITEVQNRQLEFTPVASLTDLHLSYTSDAVWVRIPIVNPTDSHGTWNFQFDYPFLNHVTLYVERAHGLEQYQHGALLTDEQRHTPFRKPVFPLSMDPGEALTLFARIETASSVSLESSLQTPRFFEYSNNQQMFWLSLYVGMLVALGLYNFLLFLGLRDKTFIIYSFFVLSFGTAAFTVHGIGTLLIWSHFGINVNTVVATGFMLSATLGTLFAIFFLNTSRHAPRWDRVLRVWFFISLLAVISGLILPDRASLQVMDIIGFATCLLLLSCGIYCASRRTPGALLFVIAWAVLLIGASSFALRNLGLLPSNFFTLHGLQVGSAIEMLLLSFALAARFNKLKRQKEDAQSQILETMRRHEAELEAKVAQRTRELEHMATHDTLTGLLNRSGLNKALQQMLARAHRNNTSLTLFMLDLDGFKPVNDQYGHEVGDEVLQEVAHRIQMAARVSDICARFGGDEFIVVADNVSDPNTIEEFTRRLKHTIRQSIVTENGVTVSVDASIGSCCNHANSTAASLLHQADMSMYNYKGRPQNA